MKAKISYYAVDDLVDISNARTLTELVRIALIVLFRMPSPIYWVAGPITSGSRTSKENRCRLHDTILFFKIGKITTLNYLPLQKQAVKILRQEFGDRKLSKMEDYGLQERLRDELYVPIFRSGKIDALCIMPESKMSLNVQWMRGFFHASGILIKLIPERLIPKR